MCMHKSLSVAIHATLSGAKLATLSVALHIDKHARTHEIGNMACLNLKPEP